MRRITALIFVAACFPYVCSAQSAPTPPDQYRDEAIIWEHYDTTIRMHADGTGERTLHVIARLQSEGAARELSVIQVQFSSAYETGGIDYLRVHKPDGTIVETPVADAIELPSPVTSMAPLYSDLKQKQLPVRSLSAGDVIDYQLRTVRTKAEVPGQFWGAEHFLRDAGVVLSQTVTLEVPASTYVQVWSPNHATTPNQQNGVRTYSWSTSQLTATGNAKTPASAADATPKIKDPDEDAEGRRLPSVAWTTFHSWAEVGNWYRGLSLSRSAPTPAIVSRANELTKDAKTPEEQVRALYDFVAAHTRYIGIDFGVGHYQPHAAEEVMSYQYGDCKDKDTLLEALLRAKGFTTAPALIGVNIAPIADLPSPALFNHVITTVDLPSGRVWLDTTAEVAPYRLLIPLIRDQQALVVPATGVAALERTPADPPFPYFERFEATGTLDKDGLLKSHMDFTMRSDNELAFRFLLQRAAPAQWDDAMQAVSRAMGFTGTVSNADLRQKDPAGPVRLSYDYNRPAFGDWDNHRILPLFPVLEIASIDKEKAPEHDIDQGWPRKLEAVTRIKLPDGYKANLPDAIHVKRDYASFDQTYRVEKDELIIERTVVILKKKVAKADWKDYNAFTKAIGLETGESYISLNGPGAIETAIPNAMAAAGTEMKEGNWERARQMLDEAKRRDPTTPYLMTMLGYLAYHDGKRDEAIQDYEAELKNYPESPTPTVMTLASFYTSAKRYDDAESLLRKYVDRNDVGITNTLAYVQTLSGKDTAALATLQGALASHPDDLSIESRLPEALHRVHRDQEAVTVIKKILSQSNNADVLNNNAYLLSEMKLELPLAEATSRRAITTLENALAEVSLQESNDRSYSQTNLLVATWDTLGWALFQQGKPAEAEPYIRASWVNGANVVVGNHLAQALEAVGKPSQALTINELALAADGAATNTAEVDEIKKNVERLRHAGAQGSVHDAKQTLQQMRTFHVPKPAATTGSGTFRITIGNDRIEGNDLIKGPAELRSFSERLNQLKVPDAIPQGSKARLFRDGVLFCSSGTSTCEFVLIHHEFAAPVVH
jgi:tetratricopeptide (TPR) repeat protein